jgi:hypothetical protein
MGVNNGVWGHGVTCYIYVPHPLRGAKACADV